MASKNWAISGEYIESCNCDYLCPCIYTNPQEGATEDHCYALMAFRIDQGESGGVDLSGQKIALVIPTEFRLMQNYPDIRRHCGQGRG